MPKKRSAKPRGRPLNNPDGRTVVISASVPRKVRTYLKKRGKGSVSKGVVTVAEESMERNK